MQAYKAYFECDRFIPLVDVEIPEGSRAIVMVLNKPPNQTRFRQRTASDSFREAARERSLGDSA